MFKFSNYAQIRAQFIIYKQLYKCTFAILIHHKLIVFVQFYSRFINNHNLDYLSIKNNIFFFYIKIVEVILN